MSSEEEIKKWACDQVSSIIGISSEECRPLIDNIWIFQTENEIRTEFQNIIGNSISTNMFINEFVTKRNLKSNSNSNLNSLNLQFDGRDSPYEYHKNEEAEEYYSGSKKKKKEKKTNQNIDKPKKEKGKNKEKEETTENENNEDSDNEKEVKLSKRQQKKLNAKKKKGGISLDEWDKEDRTFVTKGKNGRPLCPCQAAKHGLVANCLNCGKIVCKLEGPGPCPFCGEDVIDNEQQVRVYQQKQREKLKEEKTILIKNTNNKESSGSSTSNNNIGSSSSSSPIRPSQEQIDQQRSEKLAIKLEVQMEMEKREKSFEKALTMKERLLDFDKHSTERTKIYDTATDFDPNMTAANNKWLSPEERLRAIKKEQALREYEKNKRKNVKIAIDLQTKQVVELPADPFEYKDEEPTQSSKSKEQAEEEVTGTGYYINPFIKEIPKYVKVNIYDKEKKEKEKPKSILEKKNEQKEKEKAAREKAKREAAKQKEKEENKNNQNSPTTSKKNKKQTERKSGKSRIRRIQYDPEDDDMYGVDFAFSDDEDEKEQLDGVCSTDNVIKPDIVVDF